LLKRGLKLFGKAGTDKVVEELKQIEIHKVFKPKKASDLTYLKQKRCGRIKARGCAAAESSDCTKQSKKPRHQYCD
jgi:hypothetical protein